MYVGKMQPNDLMSIIFGEKPSKKKRGSPDTLSEDILGVIRDLD